MVEVFVLGWVVLVLVFLAWHVDRLNLRTKNQSEAISLLKCLLDEAQNRRDLSQAQYELFRDRS